MISVYMIITIIFFFNCLTKNNPVKMKMNLLLASLIMLMVMKNLTSSSWMPFIFCMLYLGGILMMFMILSSFLPNSKMNKSNFSKVLFFLMILINFPNSIFFNSQINNLKVFMEEKMNFIFMVLWILAIFFGFIFILSDMQLSMRSTMM